MYKMCLTEIDKNYFTYIISIFDVNFKIFLSNCFYEVYMANSKT